MNKQPMKLHEDKNLLNQVCEPKTTNALRAYLNRAMHGNDEIVFGPWANTLDEARSLLNDWHQILHTADLPEGLLRFEDEMKDKVGPMSVMKPLAARLDDIRNYYVDVLLPAKPIDKLAVQVTAREFSGNLRPQSIEETLKQMKKSTSAGLPIWAKRHSPEAHDFAVQYANALLLGYYDQTKPEDLIPAVLGWRGQEGGPEVSDTKQRVIWMFPMAYNLAELTVYNPLIGHAQKKGLVPAWISQDCVDKRVTTLFDTKGPKDLVVCTDFTRFDQHFNPMMHSAAMFILMSLFDDSKYILHWLREVFLIKYQLPLLISPTQACTFGSDVHFHGMASGSGGTNADETLAHRCLQHEVAISRGKHLNLASQCLGDDGMLSYPGITVDDVVESYSKHGQVMNKDKQSASQSECTYLRRWYGTAYRPDGTMRGVYSTCRALGRFLFQERYWMNWSEKDVAIRQLSILQNLEWHPMRFKFADWCMERDKYRLGLDIPGFLDNLPKELEESRNKHAGMISYNAENLASGINEWWIVKYLRSKRHS